MMKAIVSYEKYNEHSKKTNKTVSVYTMYETNRRIVQITVMEGLAIYLYSFINEI